MKKYFIEKKVRSIVTDTLFGKVERWDVVETIEYENEIQWQAAKESIGIPSVCWLEQDDVAYTAYVLFVGWNRMMLPGVCDI